MRVTVEIDITPSAVGRASGNATALVNWAIAAVTTQTDMGIRSGRGVPIPAGLGSVDFEVTEGERDYQMWTAPKGGKK